MLWKIIWEGIGEMVKLWKIIRAAWAKMKLLPGLFRLLCRTRMQLDDNHLNLYLLRIEIGVDFLKVFLFRTIFRERLYYIFQSHKLREVITCIWKTGLLPYGIFERHLTSLSVIHKVSRIFSFLFHHSNLFKWALKDFILYTYKTIP